MTMTAGGNELRLVKRSQLVSCVSSCALCKLFCPCVSQFLMLFAFPRHVQPANPKDVYHIPGGYAPRPQDKMERADAAEARMLSGGHITADVLLQALADKLNRKTDNIRAPPPIARLELRRGLVLPPAVHSRAFDDTVLPQGRFFERLMKTKTARCVPFARVFRRCSWSD